MALKNIIFIDLSIVNVVYCNKQSTSEYYDLLKIKLMSELFLDKRVNGTNFIISPPPS